MARLGLGSACIFVLLLTVLHFVVGEIHKFRDDYGPLKVLKLREGEGFDQILYRYRRQAAKSESQSKLMVSKTTLPDKLHNEAIVHWSGNKSDVIFVLTREVTKNGMVNESTLYKSSDYGRSFQPVNIKTLNPSKKPTISYFYPCPTDKGKLFFVDNRNNVTYRTKDEARTPLKGAGIDFQVDKVVFHPQKSDVLLVYSILTSTLRMSDDLGATWNLVARNVNPRVFWAVKGVDKDPMLIHMEVQDPATGKFSYRTCTKPYCKDVPFDKELGNIDQYSLVVAGDYIFVQQSTEMSTMLKVSYKRQPFKQAYFPLDAHPQDFNIINSDEQQVFIGARHKIGTVDLYLSDITGRFYIRSLKNIAVINRLMVDLVEVNGVRGTYLVNQLCPRPCTRQTLITFDKGGRWMLLKAPKKDYAGKPTNCELPKCSLHLHLSNSEQVLGTPPPLSEENAPGMILAQGVTGKSLNRQKSTLMISRDGGQNWTAVFQGEHNYNIIDQGGAMVAVIDNPIMATNEIKYSCTEGTTWQTYIFSKKPIHVDGVLNEPGITTRIVSVYGHQNRSSGWMILTVDFTSILSRKCGKDDFTNWTPSDEIKGHLCLLGQKLKYLRRKPEAQCYIGEDHEKAVSTTNCTCIDDDFECDYGYEASAKAKCSPAKWFNPSMPVTECPEGSFFYKSKGYRKVAADYCKDGPLSKEYAPVRTKCPLMKPEGLRIEAEKGGQLVIATGKAVTLNLIQEKGSKISTKYMWDLGNGTKLTHTGLKGHQKKMIRYNKEGTYKISVSAQNAKGVANATVYLRVEDKIKGMTVELPRAARVGAPSKFEVWVTSVSSIEMDNKDENVHFLWTFGDEGPHERPQLTWDHQVNHTFKEAKNYTVTVEALNSIGSVFQKQIIYVYAMTKTVQLSFNSEVDRFNSGKVSWRVRFANTLKNTLAQVLKVDRRRLEVVVLPGKPTVAHVSFLPIPQYNKSDPAVLQMAKKLVAHVKNSSIEVTRIYRLSLKVQYAKLLSDDTEGGKPHSPQNFIAVYVCVPILFIAAFLSVLIFLYYRRKFGQIRHYSMLRNQMDPGSDSLLDDQDDDDVPPLDPNPDTRGSSRDADEFQPFGSRSALVMMAGSNDNEESNNTENC